MKIKEMIQKALNLLYVEDIKCIVCDKELNRDIKTSICDDCIKKFILNDKHTCLKCGVKITTPYKYCPRCSVETKTYEKAESVFIYEGDIKKLIWKFKFNGGKYLGKYLSEILLTKYRSMDIKCDMVIPVPMHKERLKERGYNQVEELCKAFENEEDIEIRNDILLKIKQTKSQAESEYKERFENLKDCFICENIEELKGKTVLLIDDVMTTGTTVEECSKTLKKYGAKKVYVLTLASVYYEFSQNVD